MGLKNHFELITGLTAIKWAFFATFIFYNFIKKSIFYNGLFYAFNGFMLLRLNAKGTKL